VGRANALSPPPGCSCRISSFMMDMDEMDILQEENKKETARN
jgi:hypothetical protein